MDRSMSSGKLPQRDVESEEFDLEQRLSAAEQHYARARERSRKASDEWHALDCAENVSAEFIERARERYLLAQAKCARLRSLIEEIEERLG